MIHSLKIDQPTLIHFGGRKVGSDNRIYTRCIQKDEDDTTLAEEWMIWEDVNGYNYVKDLMGFSIACINEKFLIFGGMYLEKSLGDQRNFNRSVVEIDVHNIVIKCELWFDTLHFKVLSLLIM